LAEDVVARDPLPPFRASIKDGFAVRAEDGPGEYPVIGTVTAGTLPSFKVEKGTVARITTGSPLPEDADAIVMVEDTILLPGSPEKVRIEVTVKPGGDIRPIGCDIAVGQVILRAGDRLGAAEIGLLATIGVTEVTVYGIPKVAVLSTGDEIKPHTTPSEVLPGGCIRDSNRPMLFAVLSDIDQHWGNATVDLGIAKDTAEELEKKLKEGLEQADVIITSGGVSMGELDLMKPLLEKLGTIHFGRVEMKPGKPLTFATLKSPNSNREKLIFALPGNPVSSLVTFYVFVLISLRKLAGCTSPHLPVIQVTTSTPVTLDPERVDYHRVKIVWDLSKYCFVATTTGLQASCRLLSLKSANGLLLLPKGNGVMPAGSILHAILIGEL